MNFEYFLGFLDTRIRLPDVRLLIPMETNLTEFLDCNISNRRETLTGLPHQVRFSTFQEVVLKYIFKL